MKRRYFLGALGACAAVCATSDPLMAFALRPQRCMVTFTFDSGVASTHRYAFPVLKKWGFPATSGVVVDKMLSGDNDYMNVGNVHELEQGGWEIASHSMSRVSPLDIPRTYEQEPLSGWRPDKDHPGHFQARYDYEYVPGLYQGDVRLREVESLNRVLSEPGTYWLDKTIAELHMHSLRPGDAASLGVRTGSLQREMEQSKRTLTQLGFTVDTYMAPKNYWTPEAQDLCKKYYARACTRVDSDNRKATFDPYAIKRFTVRSGDTSHTLIRIIQDHCVASGSWVVFCFHGIGEDLGWGAYPVEGLDAVCAWVAGQKIPVVTVREGAKRMLAVR